MVRTGAGKRSVLVVEDDEATREMVAEILDVEGFATAMAANGREALILLRKWKPDLILLDLVMPGMDGWFFRAQQRQLAGIRDIPVIVMSARRPPWRQEDALNPAAYLPKPFDLDDFVGLVRNTLSKSAAVGVTERPGLSAQPV